MGSKYREKIFIAIGWTLTIFSVVMLFRQGIERSFFHQDDVVELAVVSDWKGISTIGNMNNEHLNITFWPLLRSQWVLFGINYAPYLTLNVLLHVFTLCLIFIITYKLTKSVVLASVPVWGMVINSNWFAVVWWITGQMFLLATIFALLAYWVILKINEKSRQKYLFSLLYVFSVLPGLSWGVGLSWPMWPLLVFGIDYVKKRLNKVGYTLMAAQGTLGLVYFVLVGNNLGVHTDPKTWLTNPLAIISFVTVGISNTVVGRWLWPMENLIMRVFCLGILLLIIIISKSYKKIEDKNIIFGLLVVIGSFVTFAVPRWKFGIGHAMANYYAYFPLSFLLISTAVLLSKFKLTGWKRMAVLSVFLIHIPMSWIGFEEWARDWVIRPQQTRAYFRELNSTTPEECLENIFIPTYIVPQNIWKINYLWPIFKKNFDPFCSKQI